jgi:nicotinamidase-related amidase
MRNPTKNSDLHGSAPDHSAIALLIIDMLSEVSEIDGGAFVAKARHAAKRIAKLKHRAAKSAIPCIYVNDNVGRWQSAGHRVMAQNSAATSSSFAIGQLLMPAQSDYLVLKPKHSAFFATPLDVLLTHLGTSALIVTGMVGKQCILFTAIDAYVREFQLYIPMDCIVTADRSESTMLRKLFMATLDADIRDSGVLRLSALCRKHLARPVRR